MPEVSAVSSPADENIARDIERGIGQRAARDEDPARWERSAEGVLGPSVRIEVLMQCLERAQTTTSQSWSIQRLAKTIEQRMRSAGVRPIRTAGRVGRNPVLDPVSGRPYWTAATYANFLAHRGNRPDDHHVETILDHLADIVADNIWPDKDRQRMRALLRTPQKGIADLAREILSRAVVETRLWPANPRHKFPPSAAFSFVPDPQTAGAFAPFVKLASGFLRETDGPRAFVVGGPAYSGKKTVLRHFLAECKDDYFHLADRSALSVFAASLSDQTPSQLVDNLYAFYLSAQSYREEHGPIVREATNWKLHRIEAMARTTPACILLADTDPISQDDVFRSLSDSPIDAIIATLLGAHPLTRLLFTTGENEDDDRLYREVRRLCRKCDHTRLSGEFPLTMIDGLTGPIPEGRTVDGRVWRLAKITKSLIVNADPGNRALLMQERERMVRRHDARGLEEFLWDTLLSSRRRTLLGVIAISQDGLRLSVLRRILQALRDAGARDIVDEREVKSELRALVQLITERAFDIEDELLDPGEPETESLFSIDHDWRLIFLQNWWKADPGRARLGHWLVAREAADQARRLRVAQAEIVSSECTGREIQALHALIASIDPAAVVRRSGNQRSGNADRSVEADVLPSLRVKADMPDALTALRFAYLCLYRTNIEGADYRLLRVDEDAATRLSLLLPLFEPQTPWKNHRDRRLAPTCPPHISQAFDPREIVDLLASVAIGAARLRRFDVVLAAVDAGALEVKAAGLKQVGIVNYMRLVRTEIDIGILLAGRPEKLLAHSDDEGAKRASHLIAVTSEIEQILENDLVPLDTDEKPDLQVRIARAKLRARLAEAYHGAGWLRIAEKNFKRARATEVSIVEAGEVGSSMSPILGGRGVRRYARLLGDLALRRANRRHPQNYKFKDGLVLPAYAFPSAPLPEDPYVQMLQDMNCRRLAPAHLAESVALKIDAARLATMRRRPGAALKLLDAAQASVRLSSGSDFEITLEFFALRTRIEMESGLACLAEQQKAAGATLGDVIADLRHYVGPDAPQDLAALGATMLKRARASKELLDRVTAMLSIHDAPAAIAAELLEAQLSVVETRLTNKREEIIETLKRADKLIDGALISMRETKFRLHLWHARAMKVGIADALTALQGKP